MNIKLENVSKYYNSKTNVSLGIQNVSATFKTGEIVAITGKSGSGKSTFLNVISLMDTFESGEIMYDDVCISGLPSDEIEKIRKDNIAFVFQNYNIIDSFTVLKNVMLPLIIKGFSYKDAKIKALDIISKVGLSNRVNNKGTKLSGGEKQRCVIARALASDSKILCCDEPTGNLDSKTSKEIISIIQEVAKDKLVFIVTHNYDEISSFATRKLTFFDGKLIEDTALRDIDENNVEEKKQNDEINNTVKTNYFNIFKLALTTIFSTPKKSLFIFLLSLVISYSFISLISSNIYYDDESSNVSSSLFYDNVDTNRLIIYDKNGDSINIDEINNLDDSLYFEDALYDSKSTSYKLSTDNSITSFFYKQNLTDEEIICGRMPKTSDEVVIGIPTNVSDSTMYINKYLTNRLYSIDNNSYKIVGYYKSDTDYYITSTKEGNEKIKKEISYSFLKNSSFSYYNSYLDIIDDYSSESNTKAYFETNDKDALTKLLANKNLTLGVVINNKTYKFDVTNYEFEIKEDSTIDNNQINITIDLVKYCLDNYTKTLSVYTSTFDYDDTIKLITSYDSDLVCLRPSKSLSSSSTIGDVLVKILYIIAWIGIIIVIYVSYKISYLVLSRVYKTKVNDYVIFRTMGLNESKSKYLLLFENIITIFFTSILVLIIGKILAYNINYFSYLRYFSFKYIVIYIILMILFTLFMSNKINKKIFNASVLKVLKGGNEND